MFRCDTTFEIIDKLWLTDTSYTNTALIKTLNSKYFESPGPMMAISYNNIILWVDMCLLNQILSNDKFKKHRKFYASKF